MDILSQKLFFMRTLYHSTEVIAQLYKDLRLALKGHPDTGFFYFQGLFIIERRIDEIVWITLILTLSLRELTGVCKVEGQV